MVKKSIIKLRAYQRQKEESYYLFSEILSFIAPTLAGLKPATLINISKKNALLFDSWRKHHNSLIKQLQPLVYVFELINTSERFLQLFYNPKCIRNVIKNKDNRDYLKDYGYQLNMNINKYLTHLRSRFDKTFPHEIGVFLGIPIKDIDGFVTNKGKNSVLNGYWKVYHSPLKAKAVFRAYDHAKLITIKHLLKE